MNQTAAQPKASKCIWQSGFTTSMNHQTWHASSKSRFILSTWSNLNSPFSMYPSWRVGAVDLSPLYFVDQDRPLRLSVTYSLSSQSLFPSHVRSNHLAGISVEKVFTLWALWVASSLDSSVTPDVCVLCPPRVLVDDWEVAWGRELNAQPPVRASTAQSKRA